ncbi:MAG: electron transport complex protein RnfC [Clostridiales bacterium]|nr:electron transport complex protein RnfC [Clostridiales bacterium]
MNLVSLIEKAGIVGAGGAGFPTHVKFAGDAKYIIVNAAECEPLLRVDQQLLIAYKNEILTALQASREALGAKKAIIAIKGKHREAVACLESAVSRVDGVEVFLLEDFYPAGDEQVTVYEALKKIVPEGGLPIHVQTVVVNVETMLNIGNAMKDIPVTEKYLTVTGAVKNPVTVKVPVGIGETEAIGLAGGPAVDAFAVIEGGPMMGKLIDHERAVVTKTTKAYIVLPEEHRLIASRGKSMERMLLEARIACCHCSLRTEVCPRNLLGHRLRPDRLMRMASYTPGFETDPCMDEALICSECGLCEQACVMGLQPWKLNNYLKGKLGAAGIRRTDNRAPEKVSEFREYKKFPVKRLVNQLGLSKYDVPAPLKLSGTERFTRLRIALKQHVGVAAWPVVSVGDRIEKNQLIGDIPEGKLGAKVHSGIGGKVTGIDHDTIEIARS